MYNIGVHMKKRRGFTLIEATVTLGILAIASALIILVMSALVNVQNASADQEIVSKELAAIDDIVNDYVSLVSINHDDLSFEYKSSNPSSLIYTYDAYEYVLSYVPEASTLNVTNNYDGDNQYLKYSSSITFKMVTNVVFKFDASINLLVVDVTAMSTTTHLTYVIRV